MYIRTYTYVYLQKANKKSSDRNDAYNNQLGWERSDKKYAT